MTKYFFRLDDIASNMNWYNFELVVKIFKNYNIKPLIAVIPDVKDQKLLNYPIRNDFWEIMRELRDIDWTVAQHGYRHLAGGGGGILKIHKSGEFGGIDFKNQETMINSGRKIMEAQMLFPEVFVAPRHSFDKNTIKALRENNFRFISDGIALWPFKKWNIIWLPQILWRPRKGMFGLITFALHTNTMSQEDIEDLEKFIKINRQKIGDFSKLMEWCEKRNAIKKLIMFFINQLFKIVWYLIFRLKYGLSR